MQEASSENEEKPELSDLTDPSSEEEESPDLSSEEEEPPELEDPKKWGPLGGFCFTSLASPVS